MGFSRLARLETIGLQPKSPGVQRKSALAQ
jgi:hypothetical protein